MNTKISLEDDIIIPTQAAIGGVYFDYKHNSWSVRKYQPQPNPIKMEYTTLNGWSSDTVIVILHSFWGCIQTIS